MLAPVFVLAAAAVACNGAFNRATAADLGRDLRTLTSRRGVALSSLTCPPIAGAATRHANCEGTMTAGDVASLVAALGLAPTTPSATAQGHEGCPAFRADPSVVLHARWGKDPSYAPLGFFLLYHRAATGEVCIVGTYPYG